jgi:hypothetical protein
VPEEWNLARVDAVSADGAWLAGTATSLPYDAGIPSRAWIAYVPEPGPGAAGGFALIALLGRARFARRCR